MAAIYSGIHLKLKSPQTPWEDKLKLARFAWISSQCLLPNKEQVLLDWCTHALSLYYNKKVEFSQDFLESLWCYLDDMLHSRKLQSFLKQGKTITLKLNMPQLLDQLQKCAHVGFKSSGCASYILSVFQCIFSSPALSSVFTTKYELMVDLLAKVCLLACCELQKPLSIEHLKKDSASYHDEPVTESLQTEPATNMKTSKTDSLTGSPLDQPQSEANKSFSKLKENLRSANLFEVLLQVLSSYLSVQRHQANPSRVSTMVTNHLIQPLALLRYLLTSGEFAACLTHLRLRQQLCRDIRMKIDSLLQLALFPSEHLNSYKEELLPPKEDSGKRGSGGTKVPFKPVSAVLSKLSDQGYCEPSLHYAVKSSALSLLFKFFLEKYSKGRVEDEEEQRMLCFYFLTRLVPTLDLHFDGQQSHPASVRSPENWNLAVLAMESLLSQALSAGIYNVAADRIRHKDVQLNYYRAVAQMLFNEAQPSIPSWYRCLKVLLSLNHLILEPDLDQLLSSAWINAECMEARVQRARQLMVCSLLQTYTKLRQLPRLFSELLSVICQPALDDLRPPLLSESITTSLRTCLLDTPPSQGLEICLLMMEAIRKYILPDLVKEKTEEEKMETDGEHEDQERKDASLKLFTLSQLLHAVLFNLKTLDNASPAPLVRQSQDLIKGFQDLVKELLHVVSTEKKNTNTSSVQKTPRKGRKNLDPKEKPSESKTGALWEQKTLEAALLLRYTWVEVDTLFHIHCSKYTSRDSAAVSETENEATSSSPVLSRIECLLSGNILPAGHSPSPSCSPMSCVLLKLLTLQQLKKVLLDNALMGESSTAALLTKSAQFILAKSELEVSLDGEQGWDGQIGSVNASSYFATHWYLVMSNLPLILRHLNRDDARCIANVLISSSLNTQTDRSEDQPPSCLTVSLVSSQLLQSPIFAELPSLFSATVWSLTQRIICVLRAAHAPKVCSTFLTFQEREAVSSQRDASQPLPTLVKKETIVEDILTSSKTGETFVLLTETETRELVNLLQILATLNPDGMSSDDLSSVFLLLFFMLTSTSSKPDQIAESGGDARFLGKLLRILAHLLESRNFQSVLKLMHGGTLLQATLSSLLWHSNSPRLQATSSTDWLDFIKAVQDFIQTLVGVIIIRNSHIHLNLDQFASYLTSEEMTSRQNAESSSGPSLSSVHLLLASVTSFSQVMTSNLGKSKPLNQTLTQILTKITGVLGPAVKSILKPQNVSEAVKQPASVLGQAFLVEVVTVMLQSELSSLSVEAENKQNSTKLTHMSLYQGFCQQILKEISSAPRPMDFLVSCLCFLSFFYQAVQLTEEKEEEEGEMKKGRKELDDLYIQIVQNVHRLLTAPWLSSTDLSKLEPAVQELLCHLAEKSTRSQFNLLLLMIRDGLGTDKLRAGNCREVLSAVIIIKLLSCCQLPETCFRALWLIAPQIISAMVFLVRSASQDVSLTLSFTIPMITSMTTLLRQGEGNITSSHHVSLVFGALQSVPLDHITPAVYQSAFLAVHETLFAIIQCHPQVMLNAAPSFLNVFYRLVASIVQEGRQRGDGDTGPDSDVYLQCSRLIERMYSHIATTAENFTALSAFMVAQYVTELQKVTLRPDVKLHLTEGIYLILDLCKEQDIRFLKAGLPMGVSEVFNELYGSYIHYHKAQRQGEDKYTV
ncbi:unhealthy ribosome biogenesis protein 2 homolog [Archocentrus centrarchus]|uniref:unhealthy ribosome biogenesis protein 2 homolog n=1 Tax=Archocentrus centrarchus TaxID=63155 RepID=UPI0011EA3EFF|nr:unhealthy ribosome biogenesis protein 2 homolog [Archocentrus centrarchus]XP_030582333.1 unhealthy ribosome biogenesis protein 2 homolog [Archocentrus centrarchus]